MKHTEGPWTIVGDDMLGTMSVLAGSKGVCDLRTRNEAANENAQLIAAAPELLEALELVLADNRLMNALNKQQARAVLDAVAKATGGAE